MLQSLKLHVLNLTKNIEHMKKQLVSSFILRFHFHVFHVLIHLMMNLDAFDDCFLVVQAKDDTVANCFQPTEYEGATTMFEIGVSGSLKPSYHEVNAEVRLKPTCNVEVNYSYY